MYFPATVTRYPYSSKNAHHAVTYGTPGTLSCKYSKVHEIIKDQNGEDVLTSAWLQFPKGTVINDDDKIVLPDGSTAPIVKNDVILNHMNREVCVEVYLGGKI